MIDPEILADYDGWLHRVAADMTTSARHDDLVQEGRVAMWRALSTYDESRGSLPAWLTSAARMRMRDLAWGTGQPTGHTAVRGSRQAEEGPSLDGMPAEAVEAILGYVEAAYHDGEILQIIREVLTPRQQEYVFLRFWGGLDPRSRDAEIRSLVDEFPVLSDRSTWQNVRKTLAHHLAHLAA